MLTENKEPVNGSCNIKRRLEKPDLVIYIKEQRNQKNGLSIEKCENCLAAEDIEIE